MTVVGVVEDVRYRGVTDPRLDVYLPAAQSTARVKHLMIRTNAPADRVITSVRALARELDPGVHVGEAVTMTDAVARETAPWRFAMRVLGFFGGLAALLATIGVVAVVSLVLATRRQELGVRAALGASPHRLRLHALREAARTTIAATVIGVVTAVGVGQLLESLLVGTRPSDPLAHAGAALITLAAGVFGCLLPARRAGAITPMEALRE
jgi:ABC-type antimicrobial peptide transport system permease subunit